MFFSLSNMKWNSEGPFTTILEDKNCLSYKAYLSYDCMEDDGRIFRIKRLWDEKPHPIPQPSECEMRASASHSERVDHQVEHRAPEYRQLIDKYYCLGSLENATAPPVQTSANSNPFIQDLATCGSEHDPIVELESSLFTISNEITTLLSAWNNRHAGMRPEGAL